MSTTLTDCERDVEQARAKLAIDLATLRAPETFSSFTDDLKQEAVDTKDAFVEKARSTAEDMATRLVNEIKAKVAENPAAALAIAAGIGWRLIRNPPIATVLVGAGLFSLWKTQTHGPQASDEELVERGKQRLQEQLSTAAAGAKDLASEAAQAAMARAGEVTEAARQTMEAWTDQGRAMAHDAGDAVKQQAAEWTGRIKDAGAEARDAVTQRAADMADRVADAGQDARATINDTMQRGRARMDQFVEAGAETTSRAVQGLPAREQVLLGVAGIAVAAALGIACQRRALEDA